MNENVIMSLVEISKTYAMGEVSVEALKKSSLDIYAGELVVILGPSGSGKSTLLGSGQRGIASESGHFK